MVNGVFKSWEKNHTTVGFTQNRAFVLCVIILLLYTVWDLPKLGLMFNVLISL